MSMPPPPKYSRIDKFIKKQWANYLKMSLRYCRDQLEEEEEENVVKLINDELKEDKHDTRYNTSAKIMAIYKNVSQTLFRSRSQSCFHHK